MATLLMSTYYMTVSMALPQELIDHIIAQVADRYHWDALQQCSLVSHSFLLPSRKHLFTNIHINRATQCDKLHAVLARHPYIQSFIQYLRILYNDHTYPDDPSLCDNKSLIAILQLPLRCLKDLTICSLSVPLKWDNLNHEMKHALWVIIRCPTLTELTCSRLNIPATLLFDTPARTLVLEQGSLNLNVFDTESSLDSQTGFFSTRIEHCIWRFYEKQHSLYFCYLISE